MASSSHAPGNQCVGGLDGVERAPLLCSVPNVVVEYTQAAAVAKEIAPAVL